MLYNFFARINCCHAPNDINWSCAMLKCFFPFPLCALEFTVEGKLTLVPVWLWWCLLSKAEIGWFVLVLSSSPVPVSGLVVQGMCWTKIWEPGSFCQCCDRFHNAGDKLGCEFFFSNHTSLLICHSGSRGYFIVIYRLNFPMLETALWNLLLSCLE